MPEGCLFCTHPRAAHTGCKDHGDCCAEVDCICIGYTEPVRAMKQHVPDHVSAIRSADLGADLIRIEFVGVGGLILNAIVVARKEAREIGRTLIELADEPPKGAA